MVNINSHRTYKCISTKLYVGIIKYQITCITNANNYNQSMNQFSPVVHVYIYIDPAGVV